MVEIIELNNQNSWAEMYAYNKGDVVSVKFEDGTLSLHWRLVKREWNQEDKTVYWTCFRPGDGYTRWSQKRFVREETSASSS